MDSLKLLPKNKKDDTDNVDSCDGILTKAIENRHPVANTQWKDRDNFQKMFEAIWRGHTLKNMGMIDTDPTYANIMQDMAIENTSIASNEGGDNNG